jgi:flagellar biosynthesis/type III secretory pathway protein FliH
MSETEYDRGFSAGVACGRDQGAAEVHKQYATPIESMRNTIERLRESNALICEIAVGHLKPEVAEKIRKHAYRSK